MHLPRLPCSPVQDIGEFSLKTLLTTFLHDPINEEAAVWINPSVMWLYLPCLAQVGIFGTQFN